MLLRLMCYTVDGVASDPLQRLVAGCFGLQPACAR